MRKFSKIIVCALTTSLLISSCSFEKRLYNKGYHIDWASKNTKEQTRTEVAQHNKHQEEPRTSVPINHDATAAPIAYKNHISPIISADPQTNDTRVLATNQNIIAPTNSTTSSIQNTRPETKIAASDVVPKNKKLIKKLIRRGADDTVLYVILALLIPPLAMFFYEGENWTDRCTLNLILTLLCWLPGVIHALFVILDNR